MTYLSSLLPVVEQRTSTATSGTATTTSVWHVWLTTTWWTLWRSAPPTRSCCCPPAMTLPLRCGARRAWCACRRSRPGRRDPAASCRPGWAATRTQRLPAAWTENHESGWKNSCSVREWGEESLIFFLCGVNKYIYTPCICTAWLQSVVLLGDTQQCSVSSAYRRRDVMQLRVRHKGAPLHQQRTESTTDSVCCGEQWYEIFSQVGIV